MFSKIWFTLVQYLWLTGLVLSAYGAGALLIDRCPSATRWSIGLRVILCITNGLGLLLLSFLGLGVVGVFKPAPVLCQFSSFHLSMAYTKSGVRCMPGIGRDRLDCWAVFGSRAAGSGSRLYR